MDNNTSRIRGRPKHDTSREPVQDVLLRTAARLFMEKGYEQVSLDHIARACNVSKPSIYYHFANKPELFKASVIALLNMVNTKTAHLLDEAGDLESGLLNVAETRLANPHPEFEMIMKEAANYLSPDQLELIRAAEQQIYHLLASRFKLAMEQGEFRTNDPMLLAQTFSTMLLLGNRHDTRQQFASPSDLGKQIVDLFLHGASFAN
ncbi:AcrR family transcriptional regulator [Paenibacillus phyllosphaerae]|uniref:AcrR family transcriptional regulator n=1 Tax=Paenibacillus phyllosphaerae TaxID=274593 RepID=A0A7W5AZM9_9BACL|nr:TetR/AcrR family transcriptional regulator [Paenibacillus phyllosphaerae]MBB3111735.1 AcrR family transcriptional regulator [Paenibacillus phyllosphaerae]